MGMAHYTCFADIVEERFVKNICKKEYMHFIKCTNEANLDLDEFAVIASTQDLEGELEVAAALEEDIENKIIESLNNLVKALKKDTNWLELSLNYHEAEDLSDDIDGVVWQVEGVYQLTPAGEKYKDKIVRKFWTTFG